MMKCELCHKKEAETALTMQKDGKEVELYVCKACAQAERKKHPENFVSNDSSRSESGDVQISFSGMIPGGPEIPPDMAEKVMSAVDDIFSQLKSELKNMPSHDEEPESDEGYFPKRAYRDSRGKGRHLGLKDFDHLAVVRDCLHLEGLFQTSGIYSILSSCSDRGVSLVSYEFDDGQQLGHLYEVRYTCPKTQAVEFVKETIERELQARQKVLNDFPRRFGDMICRALAILKCCRLLDPDELLDLLSPVRLAVIAGVLDGITLDEVDSIMTKIDLKGWIDVADVQESYENAIKLADVTTMKFAKVFFNENAKRILK